MSLEHNQRLMKNMYRSSNVAHLAMFVAQHKVSKTVRVVAPDFLNIAMSAGLERSVALLK